MYSGSPKSIIDNSLIFFSRTVTSLLVKFSLKNFQSILKFPQSAKNFMNICRKSINKINKFFKSY